MITKSLGSAFLHCAYCNRELPFGTSGCPHEGYCGACCKAFHFDPRIPDNVIPFVQKKRRTTMSSTPTPLTKAIVIAPAGRTFANGVQAFDLTAANIDEIISTFTKLGRQVPLLLPPEHVFSGARGAIPASGWIESMRRE